MACNHWDLAVESHNANHPDTDHDVANIAEVDPRRYPRTDILWASPECTTWSQARGRRRDYADQAALFDAPLPDEATMRSRATMGDVIRFTTHHRYEAVVVENVVDIRAWALWHAWIGEMADLGYRHREVYLNSMHAWGAGDAAPQSRDRIYVVFWKRGNRAPDLERWLSPPAWCPSCSKWCSARQWWKNPDRAYGRYGARAQYLYRCPTVGCHRVLEPATLPAAGAIDWTLPAQRIGARTRPLAAKTRARIAAGIRRYARPHTRPFITVHRGGPDEVRTRPLDSALPALTASGNHLGVTCPPLLVPAGGSWREDAAPVTDPMATRTTRESDGLAVPPLLIPVEGRDGKHAAPASQPLRTQTGRGETGVLPSLAVPLRTHGTATPTSEPLRTLVAGNAGMALVEPFLTALRGDHPQDSPANAPMATVCASGNHLGLVMRNNTPRGDAGQMLTPVSEPLRTLTTAGHQSVITCPMDALYAYDTGLLHSLGQPLPTQTTVEGDAVMRLADLVDLDDETTLNRVVDECTFRMLTPAEMALGMAFPVGYVVLGNKSERTRQIGNAVTPPVARDLIAAIAEALTGEEVAA